MGFLCNMFYLFIKFPCSLFFISFNNVYILFIIIKRLPFNHCAEAKSEAQSILSCPCGSAVASAATAIACCCRCSRCCCCSCCCCCCDYCTSCSFVETETPTTMTAAASTEARARSVGSSQFATRIRSGKKQLRKWVSELWGQCTSRVPCGRKRAPKRARALSSLPCSLCGRRASFFCRQANANRKRVFSFHKRKKSSKSLVVGGGSGAF